jgi:soluble lytic murein transglycosylase-like protein
MILAPPTLCEGVVSFSGFIGFGQSRFKTVITQMIGVRLHIARIKMFALFLIATILAQFLSQELINSPNSFSAQAARRKAEAAELVQNKEKARLAELARLQADRDLRARIEGMTFYEAPAAVMSDVQLASNRTKGFSAKDEVLVRNDDLLVTGSLKSGVVKEVVAIDHPFYALASLQSVIQKHALAEGVPLALAHAIVRSESGFNPNVTNAGAQGLMQIKLQAAQTVGYQGTADGLLDANTNLRFGMRYLGRIYQSTKGDACRTIAIYRSGNPATATDNTYCAKAFKDEASKDGEPRNLSKIDAPGVHLSRDPG